MMKKIAFIALAAAVSVWADAADLLIWFDAPATQFTQRRSPWAMGGSALWFTAACAVRRDY